MSQTGYTPISLYYSATASAAPVAGNLVAGELALNTNDGKLFYKDSSGVVQTLATKSSASGSFTTLSASSTVTFSGGTANGVAYLNGSKVLTTGSALTFDGATLTVDASATGLMAALKSSNANGGYFTGYSSGTAVWDIGTAKQTINTGGASDLGFNTRSGSIMFGINTSEQMRLTSTGLGIGTSSPSYKFQVSNTSGYAQMALQGSSANGGILRFYDSAAVVTASIFGFGSAASTDSYALRFDTNGAERMRLDSSGNLGLGVTPSAWGGGFKAFELVGGSVFSGASTNLGIMQNAYYDGTNYLYKTSSTAARYFQVGGQHIWYNAPSGTAGNAISFTQAMTLNASGYLGIGATNPATPLEVWGSSRFANGAANSNIFQITPDTTGSNGVSLISTYYGSGGYGPIKFFTGGSESARIDAIGNLLVGGTTNTGGLKILATDGTVQTGFLPYATGSVAYTGTWTNHAYAFAINGSEKARIDSSGRLLVGLTSSLFTNAKIQATNSSGPTLGIQQTTSTEYAGGFWNNATGSTNLVAFYSGTSGNQVGGITFNGSLVLYNATSDKRLKENILDAASASDLIDAIQVRQYDWKSNGSHQRYGFIAQELVTVAPEAVYQPADPEEMMAVDYSKLVPMLVKEIQSLRTRLAQLEGK
jgi:hypothetical protein